LKECDGHEVLPKTLARSQAQHTDGLRCVKPHISPKEEAMGEKISIDSFTGGSNGDDLLNCYFKYKKSDETYTFHDKDDHSKCTGMTVGSTCSFTLDEFPGIQWTITLISPCTETEVNGNWTSDDGNENTQEGGTFQAQDGGGISEQEEGEVNEQKPHQDIVIYAITSDNGTDFGDVLVDCSFTLEGNSGRYQLRDPDGGVLHRDITSKDKIRFKYMSQSWEMNTDIHTLEAKAHGGWILLEGESGAEVDGGTFQAQAGGGGADEGTAYAASAS